MKLRILILSLLFICSSAAVFAQQLPESDVQAVECPNCAGQLTVNPALSPIGMVTYVVSTSGNTAANPTDIAVLSGNNTNTVVVTGVWASCTLTTSGVAGMMLVDRSTADSGGTSTAIPIVPLDSKNAVAVSAPLFYTANPTLGTAVGVIYQKKMVMQSISATANNGEFVWQPSQGQRIVLRGPAQQVAINLGGQTLGGANCAVNFQWIETTIF